MSKKLLLEILIIEKQKEKFSQLLDSLDKKIFESTNFKGNLDEFKDLKIIIYDAIVIGSMDSSLALKFGLYVRSFEQLNHIPIIFLVDSENSIRDYQMIKNNVWFVHNDVLQKNLEPTLKSALRSHKSLFQSKFIKYKDLILNTQTQELHKNGNMVPLSAIEYRIMELLLRYPSHIFSREDIISRAWDPNLDDPMSKRAVDTHVNRLRNLLRKHLKVYDLIKTIRSQGYCISFGDESEEY